MSRYGGLARSGGNWSWERTRGPPRGREPGGQLPEGVGEGQGGASLSGEGEASRLIFDYGQVRYRHISQGANEPTAFYRQRLALLLGLGKPELTAGRTTVPGWSWGQGRPKRSDGGAKLGVRLSKLVSEQPSPLGYAIVRVALIVGVANPVGVAIEHIPKCAYLAWSQCLSRAPPGSNSPARDEIRQKTISGPGKRCLTYRF